MTPDAILIQHSHYGAPVWNFGQNAALHLSASVLRKQKQYRYQLSQPENVIEESTEWKKSINRNV